MYAWELRGGVAGKGSIKRAKGGEGRVKGGGRAQSSITIRDDDGAVRRIIRVKDSRASCSAKGG